MPTSKNDPKSNTKKSPSKPSPIQSTGTPAATPPPAPGPQPSPVVITTANATADAKTKLGQQAQFSATVAGLLAYYQPGDTFLVEGTTYTRDEAVAQMNRFIQAAEQTKADYTTYRESVQNEREVLAEVRPIRSGVMAVVTTRFGKGSPTLLQFGKVPNPPKPMTVEAKSEAVAKQLATKEARGIIGKKQRKAITAPAAASPTTAPAPAPEPATATAPAAAAPAKS
jgi:hypothetical protein